MPRSFIAVLLVMSFALSAMAADVGQKAKSTVYRLRMRSTPASSAKVVGYLAKGEEVTVVQQSTFSTKVDKVTDSWYEVVNSSGIRGWVFGYYLQTEGNH